MPMLYVKLIITIIEKTGIVSEKSSNFRHVMGENMSTPTMIREGPYANAGMDEKKGAKKSARRKRRATTTAVSPDFPPAAIPGSHQPATIGF